MGTAWYDVMAGAAAMSDDYAAGIAGIKKRLGTNDRKIEVYDRNRRYGS